MGNILLRHQLKGRTKDNTPVYGFEGQQMWGKVVSVYDGDTCRAVVKINGNFTIINVRCYGYDSPEMKPPLKDTNRDMEIAKSKVAKAALESMVLNKLVLLKICGSDKYGRFLATIYVKGWCSSLDVNREMVSSGHGVEYFGGTKGTSSSGSNTKKKEERPPAEAEAEEEENQNTVKIHSTKNNI